MEKERSMGKKQEGTAGGGGIRSGGYAYTDLACEAMDINGRGGADGRREEEILRLGGEGTVHLMRHWLDDGGQYVTVCCGRIPTRSEAELDELADVLSDELVRMTTAMLGRVPDPSLRVLVVGLGNAGMTPDAIGPETVRRLTVTRHLKAYNGDMYAALGCCELAAVSPGVLGQTGVETAELVKGVVAHVKPDVVIAVDALAARSCDRLAATVQMSDRGIGPGAGVGNRRTALDETVLGCPVLAFGVPTVVDSTTLVYDALEQAGMTEEDLTPALKDVLEKGRSFVVSPRDSDRVTELTSILLARALDRAFGIEGL